jgi:hypothetical protein
MGAKIRSLCSIVALSCFFTLMQSEARAQGVGCVDGQLKVVDGSAPGVEIEIIAQSKREPRFIYAKKDGAIKECNFRTEKWFFKVSDGQGWKQLNPAAAVSIVSGISRSLNPDPVVQRQQSHALPPGSKPQGAPMFTIVVYRVPEQQQLQQQPQSSETPKKLPTDSVSPDFHGIVKKENGFVDGAEIGLYVPDSETRRLILVYRTHTSPEGQFDLPVMAATGRYGRYLLFIAHDGFEPYSISIKGGQMPPQTDFELEPEKPERAVEEVEVERLDVSRRNVYGPRIIEALPLSGFRSFDALAMLAPGVLPPPATYASEGPGVSPSVGTAGSFSVNGIRSRENNFTVDGSDNNDEDIGTRRQGFITLSPQAVETLQEFQIITALADARYGRNIGGQVNAVTKTGSHAFHGSVYGYYTSDRFNARDFFDSTAAGGPATFTLRRSSDNTPVLFDGNPLTVSNPSNGENKYRRKQEGFDVGGRVYGTHTFFFLAGERQNLDANKESHFAVPTVAQRGIFNTGETGLLINGSPSFPSSLPGDAVFSLYPFPNNPSGPYGANTFTSVLPADGHGVRIAAKLDHTFDANGVPHIGPWWRSIFSRPAYGDQLIGRYNFTQERTTLPVTGGAIFSSLRPMVRTQNVALYYNRILSGRMSDTVRASFGRTRLFFNEVRSPLLSGSTQLPNVPFLLNAPLRLNVTMPTSGAASYVSAASSAGNALLNSLGLNGVTQSEEITGPLGQIFIPGFSPLGVDVYNFPQERANNTIQVADTFTYNAEDHLYTFGFEMRKTHINSTLDRNFRPLAVFSGLRDQGSALPLSRPDQTPINQNVLAPTTLAAAGVPTGMFQTIAPVPNSTIGIRFTQLNLFAQDEWQPRSDLRLTYGLRYEINSIPDTVGRKVERALDQAELQSQVQLIAPECALNGRCSDLLHRLTASFPSNFKLSFGTDRNDFDARVGFVYDPGQTGKFAIRGGFGHFSGQFPGIVLSQSRNAFSDFLPLNYANFSPRSGNASFLFNLANPNVRQIDPALNIIAPGTLNATPNVNPLSVLVSRLFNSAVVPNAALGLDVVLPQERLSTPIAYQYGITIEGEVPGNYVLSAAYVGTRGLKLLRMSTPDAGLLNSSVVNTSVGTLTNAAPFPFFQGFERTAQSSLISNAFSVARSVFESSASSSYNSLQGEIRKRYSHHFQFGIAFTYSHAFDDTSDFLDTAGAFALPQNSTLRSERGSSSYDARLRLVSHFVIDIPRDLPFVKLGRDLGGWQIAGVIVNQTGQPFTVNSAFDINRDGNLTDRLDSTAGLSTDGDDRRIKLNLNPGVDPQSLLAEDGADGSVGRNTFRANGIGDVDLSVTKVMKINERYRFLFRTEIYNLFNRTHFAVPERILESPAFGASTRTTIPARMIQFLLKFNF